MPDNELKIKLQVQNQKANQQLKQTGKSIKDIENKAKNSEKELSRMRVATAGLRRTMGALRNNLLLVTFAFGGLVAGIGKAVKAAGEQELAEKKLETALGKTSQALLDQASALQSVTTFGDENIIQAQALIAAFTDDEEAIKKATEATLDLSAAKGMDLFAAADLVAKTLGSSTNAMSRYGIEVTGAVGSTERLNTLTENIAKTFGGQATAQAETFSGQIKQMTNALGDTAEAFGRLLFPLLIPVANALKVIGENATFALNALKKAFTKEQASLIIGDDLALQEFNKTIDEAANYQLVQLAFSMRRISILTELQTEKQIALIDEMSKRGLLDLSINEIQIRRIEKTEEEMSLQEKFLSNFEKLNRLKEGVVKVDENQLSIDEAIIVAKQERADAEIKLANVTATAFKQFAGGAKIAARIQQAAATVDAYRTINKIMADPKLLFPTNVLTATAVGVQAFANVMSISKMIGDIKSAATGADFVTSGPQLMMVGDNPGGGREHVQVTPISSPNTDGPQGSGLTVNVSGNVMSDRFVEEELSEKIKEGIRRGVDFGIG